MELQAFDSLHWSGEAKRPELKTPAGVARKPLRSQEWPPYQGKKIFKEC